MSDVDINLNPESGTMVVRINLKSNKDFFTSKTFAYGALKVAEEEMGRFFLREEVRQLKMKQALGIVKPENGLAS